MGRDSIHLQPVAMVESIWNGADALSLFSLNRASSCNSATYLSHAFLCFERCFFLHAALQYLTILHLLHVLVLRLPYLFRKGSFAQKSHFNLDYFLAKKGTSTR